MRPRRSCGGECVRKTVFWSWQSDLDGRVTRDVIRTALDEAITILAAELEEADRPSLTSDTQGVAGTPDIVATILAKIDEAAVFVGDVTPIALSDSGKACANPNVLLEMGYANKALTSHRVIQVWNTAFEGAIVEKLPFDLRGRRGPLSFDLPIGADTTTLRAARTKLAKELAGALKLAFDTLPPPSPEAVHWQPPFSGDTDIWFDPGAEQNRAIASRLGVTSSMGSPSVCSTRTSVAPSTFRSTAAMRLAVSPICSKSSPNTFTARSLRTPAISSLNRIWIG